MAVDLGGFDIVLHPGRGNSGPHHWMSYWAMLLPNSTRLLHGEWEKPQPDAWISQLDRHIALSPRRLVIIAHSLGVATTVKWAERASADQIKKVAAVMLVAPTHVGDPDPSFDLVRPFAPVPATPLPFPALVVASRNDPRVTFAKARQSAQEWGADFADAGEVGHLGNADRLETWAEGLVLLGQLIARIA